MITPRVPLCRAPREGFEAASREQKIVSSGASSRLVFGKKPGGLFPNRLPAEIGSSVACRTFCPLPDFRGGWDFRPDHKNNLNPLSESRQAKNMGASLWIAWISGTTVGTISKVEVPWIRLQPG